MPTTANPSPPPSFEHVAFPIGFAFVAGFIDLFGFMAWGGLLAAHVTGNLIFLAYDITRGQYALVMKLAALPVFAASVAASAWFIGRVNAQGRHPFLPSIMLQAAALGACLIAGLLLPPPQGPDDIAVLVAGSIAGGLAQLHFGYPGLLLPIAVLLALLPFGRAALRAAERA